MFLLFFKQLGQSRLSDHTKTAKEIGTHLKFIQVWKTLKYIFYTEIYLGEQTGKTKLIIKSYKWLL